MARRPGSTPAKPTCLLRRWLDSVCLLSCSWARGAGTQGAGRTALWCVCRPSHIDKCSDARNYDRTYKAYTTPYRAREAPTEEMETYLKYDEAQPSYGSRRPTLPRRRTHAVALCDAPYRIRAHRPRHGLPRHPPSPAPIQLCLQGAPQLRPAAPDGPATPPDRVILPGSASLKHSAQCPAPAAAAASEAVPLRRHRLPAWRARWRRG